VRNTCCANSHLLLGRERALLALLPPLLLSNKALQSVASSHLASMFGHQTHFFFLRIYYLLLLRLLYGRVDLRAHRRSLGLHGVTRLLQFLLGGGVTGADAQR
jgi:hypothetical protein